MSHIVELTIELRDVDAIVKGAARLGLIRLEQSTYRTFGLLVGDYPMPAGFTQDDLGHCEFALGLPGCDYEIGVAKRRDGQPGYTLLMDFWGPGQRLLDAIGNGEADPFGRFKQAYGVELAKSELALEGWQVNEILAADGSIELVATQ